MDRLVPVHAADYLVAVTIATEVPPRPTDVFTADMIDPAIRAVCEVIHNRTADPHFPDSPVAVVLQPKAFSADCKQDYWFRAVAGSWLPRHVARCYDTWMESSVKPWTPLVRGAVYYFSPVNMNPRGAEPKWMKGLEEVVFPAVSNWYFRWFR